MIIEQKKGNLLTALQIAMAAHNGQKDKAGEPYILHPLTVATMQTNDEAAVVALLHDVVEDSDFEISGLREHGFSETILEAVDLLTHKKGVSYEDYIEAIRKNDLARVVKAADLCHNLDESRLTPWRSHEEYIKRVQRREKYLKAFSRLVSMEDV